MVKSPTDELSPPTNPRPSELGQVTFGSWLRQQREARSVSLREIADASKISLRYLEALETDRFDALPAPVFARGFLREYARVVGLEPDEVVNLFLIAAGSRAEVSTKEAGRGHRQVRAGSSRSTLGYGLLLGLAVIAFLGVAASLSFYAEKRRTSAAPESSLVAPVGARAQPGKESAASESNPPFAPAPGDRAASEPPTRPAAGQAPATASDAGEPPLKVLLSFKEDCWVESIVDGRRRASELRAGGESVQLEAEEAVVLTLGNSSAVEIEVNGRPFALPTGAAGRVLRDLRIDRSALPATASQAPLAR